MKTALRIGFASVFASILAAGAACAAEPAIPEIAAKTFKVGDLELVSLHDTQFVMPNDAKVFGLDAGVDAVTTVLKDAGAPTDKITLSVDALLVKDGGRLILIDTGVGPKGGKLIESLKYAGVTPDQITDVLISHGHGDHIGGLINADGTPAFKNAKVRMTAAEWEAIKAGGRADAIVAAIIPQVETFAPGAQISPSVKAVEVKGHTPGHSAYEITSGKDSLLAIGDSAHSSIISLAKPEWFIQFDGDKPTARDSRKELLSSLAKSGQLVFSPHFPYPGVGTIKVKGEGFVWEPALKP
ncbi:MULTISPECIES: MBL fold metallo-hydrolase [Asticcacaulis]|uniref:MBL fold metallo-hydrolase n=1 Tax=Asticcacaulis TaxID=76890 RepID=UPI001AE6E6B8|nr:MULTISPECIES: MBL fold metallo-hydrolase [Asticcacaulis]MBP2159464.1 glyoxylase-like metal-dependent hydrolase (beta-lactamase superfamily II) [Asticcacaulis solisilvae]MDR6800709.1 glyoxylase-like metal-dependent hydrolase (beta-lactamase superfamily II) [Asticcacaulis sp. BE141]